MYVYDKYHKNRDLPTDSIRRPSVIDRDEKKALERLGDGSVYQFFMGVSICGWVIVLLTLATQLGMLFIFVEGAEIDLSDDNVDLIYSWKCNRDQIDCDDTSDLDWRGWTVFGVLMATHLLKDIINGVKLVTLSAKQRHNWDTRLRYFIGGTLMVNITAFTLYVSTIYNAAIATSKCLSSGICSCRFMSYISQCTLTLFVLYGDIDNTEIIANSVIILFIMDIDELIFDIMTVINTNWVKSMSLEDGDLDLVAQRVEGRMQRLEKKDKIQAQTIKVNRQNIELIMQHIPELNKLKLHASVSPRDEYASVQLDEYEDSSDEESDLKD